jgi:two-component system response regulator DegU
MNKKKIKILIADDHELIRGGLKRLIGFEDDMTVMGEAENGERALELIDDLKPDILLLDIRMPHVCGTEVLKKIRDGNLPIKVIMLTVENDRKTIHSAIDIGADGYVLKDSAGEEIINAIRTVIKGEKYIDRSLVSLIFSDIRNKNQDIDDVFDKLSRREVEVLLKISEGLSNKEIGEQLYLSEKTIKNYATNLFVKINVHDRVQATIFAFKNNIDEYYKTKFKEK